MKAKKYNKGGLMNKAKKNYDRMQAADKSVAGRARNSSTNSRSTEQRLVERAGINFKEDSKTGRKLAPRTMMPKGAVPEATALARESRGGQSRKKKMQVPSVKKPKGLKGRTSGKGGNVGAGLKADSKKKKGKKVKKAFNGMMIGVDPTQMKRPGYGLKSGLLGAALGGGAALLAKKLIDKKKAASSGKK